MYRHIGLSMKELAAGVSVLLLGGGSSKSTQILMGSLASLKATRFRNSVCLKKYKSERKPGEGRHFHTGQDFWWIRWDKHPTVTLPGCSSTSCSCVTGYRRQGSSHHSLAVVFLDKSLPLPVEKARFEMQSTSECCYKLLVNLKVFNM